MKIWIKLNGIYLFIYSVIKIMIIIGWINTKRFDKTNNKMKLIDNRYKWFMVVIYLYYFSFLWIESYMNSYMNSFL